MRTIHFTWGDQEDYIISKYNFQMPKDHDTSPQPFDIEKAKGYEAVTVKVGSSVRKNEIDILAENGCKMIVIRCAGFDMVDVDYATQKGLKVYRVASYSPESIAEFAITLMLSLARKMTLQRDQHSNGKNGRTLKNMGLLLKGRVLGLHGYGKIARHVAKIARDGFGMTVQFFDPYFTADSPDTKLENLQDLYATSNIVSIHVPLNDETKGSVNASLFDNVKEDFMLINTARGLIVNSADIKELFKAGKIQYLGIDVWNSDDAYDPELLTDRSIQTDHVAFFTETAIYQQVLQSMESLNGEPRKENILPR
ncbi:hypothetical protein GF357_05000 [Candidatus Dojkabacteria bacterium]|nr:hypothetical protein [Candidatus Dojkabacteria bacterium]